MPRLPSGKLSVLFFPFSEAPPKRGNRPAKKAVNRPAHIRISRGNGSHCSIVGTIRDPPCSSELEALRVFVAAVITGHFIVQNFAAAASKGDPVTGSPFVHGPTAQSIFSPGALRKRRILWLKRERFIFLIDQFSLLTTDVVPEFGINSYLLHVGVEIDMVLLALSLQRRQGEINYFLNLPRSVAHVSIRVNPQLKPLFCVSEQLIALTIFGGHFQDHFA